MAYKAPINDAILTQQNRQLETQTEIYRVNQRVAVTARQARPKNTNRSYDGKTRKMLHAGLKPYRMYTRRRRSELPYHTVGPAGKRTRQKVGNHRPRNPISVRPLISYLVILCCFEEKTYEDSSYRICSLF